MHHVNGMCWNKLFKSGFHAEGYKNSYRSLPQMLSQSWCTKITIVHLWIFNQITERQRRKEQYLLSTTEDGNHNSIVITRHSEAHAGFLLSSSSLIIVIRMVPHHRVVLYKALLAFAVTVVWPVWPSAAIIGVAAMTSKNQNNQNGIFGAIHKQYAPLSKTSQGLTCAVLGFTGARVLVNSASTVVKVAGVAFLAYVTVNEYVFFWFFFFLKETKRYSSFSRRIPVAV